MSFVAVAIGGAALVGAGASIAASSSAAGAAKQGAQLQTDAANRAADLQHSEYLQTRDDYAPWRAAGTNALKVQSDLLGFNGPDAQTAARGNFQTDPGYAFTRDQAIQGVDRSAAARGLLTSGATVKAIQDRATSLADQEYGNYFNRLSSVAGNGQTATNGTSAAGQNAVNAQGQAIMAGGNAAASGYTNAATATNNGIGGGISALNGGVNNYLSYRMFGPSSGGGGGTNIGGGNPFATTDFPELGGA